MSLKNENYFGILLIVTYSIAWQYVQASFRFLLFLMIVYYFIFYFAFIVFVFFSISNLNENVKFLK